MTTINTARPVTRPVAAWRRQLPTLIRVYGIILTLVLLVAVVDIGNPAFLSAQEHLQHAVAVGARRDHGGRYDIRHPDRRLRSVGGVGLFAVRRGRCLCRAKLSAIDRFRGRDRRRAIVRIGQRSARRRGPHQSLHHHSRQRLRHQRRRAGHDQERRLPGR